MEIVVIISIVVVLIVQVISAMKMAEAAAQKGYGSEYHIFAFCFWLGIIGFLYALSLPDLTVHEQNEKIIELLSNTPKEEIHKNIIKNESELPPL